MTPRPIAQVILDPILGLLIVPQGAGPGTYEHIHRAANGLRWHRDAGALCAHEPQRWSPEELLEHIATTLAHELGERLKVTSQTTWQAVSPALETKLRYSLREGGA